MRRLTRQPQQRSRRFVSHVRMQCQTGPLFLTLRLLKNIMLSDPMMHPDNPCETHALLYYCTVGHDYSTAWCQVISTQSPLHAIMLTRSTAAKAVLALTAAFTLLYLAWGSPKQPQSTLSFFSLFDACAGWQPGGDAAADSPNCLRARQFREFQAFHGSGE